jgi:PTH1 family peptidyl-tRNA hydrolase
METEAPAARVAVVGLGNPGADYARTRHNVGFDVVDRLASKLGVGGVWRSECSALLAEAGPLLLVKPQTWMNRSGYALRCLQERGWLGEPDRVLIVYDEVALPLGTLRLRGAGGPGGHRGLESIVEHLRSDAVPRLRCGVGDGVEREHLADFVLSRFSAGETEPAEAMIERAAEACRCWVEEGLERAANRFNGPAR